MSMAQVGDINMELKWIVLHFYFVAASHGSYWLFTIMAALMIITLSISPSHVKVLNAMFRSSASNYQGWWLIRIVLIFLVLAEQTWLSITLHQWYTSIITTVLFSSYRSMPSHEGSPCQSFLYRWQYHGNAQPRPPTCSKAHSQKQRPRYARASQGCKCWW